MVTKPTQHYLKQAIDAERNRPNPDWGMISGWADEIGALNRRDRDMPETVPFVQPALEPFCGTGRERIKCTRPALYPDDIERDA